MNGVCGSIIMESAASKCSNNGKTHVPSAADPPVDSTAQNRHSSVFVHCHPVAKKVMEQCKSQSDPEDMLPASAIFYHIYLLNSVLERAGNRIAERHELTMPQWMALGCIAKAGQEGITHSQLGQRLMLSKAPITGVVDRLERDGYVFRAVDNKDRRVSRITITSKGEQAWHRVREELRNTASDYCSHLSPGEQQTLLSLLARLLDAAASADPLLTNIEE
jgi:MarR family 2-MHQ and catechol resistance regulon transcriptional repressor